MEGINTPFVIDEHTAIVMTDPQNDFLSENGLGWGAFGENIQKNGTVENLRRIFEVAAAKVCWYSSPHTIITNTITNGFLRGLSRN